ncbi:hypothetical protein D3C76_1786090 [compost metagenome]
MAGICPGPSLVLLGSGIFKGAVFVMAMLAGMALFEWFERQSRRGSSAPVSVGKST